MPDMLLQAAIDAYLLASRAEGKSEKTISWYVGKLRQFVASVGNVPLGNVDANVLRTYILDLRQSNVRYAGQTRQRTGKLSLQTVRGHHQMLRAFYNWLVTEYDLDPKQNPMTKIKKPTVGQPEPKALDFADFRRMLAVCDDSPMGRRNRAILMFLADTGCRAGGLVSLTDAKLDLDQRRAIVHEKGNKDRYVHFLPVTADVLFRWLDVRPAGASTVICAVNSRYSGQPLHVEGLHRVLARVAKQAGVEGRSNPHGFRHMFAMESLENGNDLVTVSNLLGHTNLKTTEYYLRFTEKQRAKRHDQYSPLINL